MSKFKINVAKKKKKIYNNIELWVIKMKKCIRLLLILSLISMFTINIPYYSYGTNDKETQKQEQREEQKNNKKSTTKTIDTDITSDNFLNEFDPNKKASGAVNNLSSSFIDLIVTVVNKILGIIQQLGGLLSIVSVAIFGFALVISGNEKLAGDLNLNIAGKPRGKKELMDFSRSMLIGSVLLFSSATLVRFVFKIFNI